ncbi:MAG: glycogen synthase GlgA [Holophagales bacterium]|jgi:starch synthase|nr:glycogen synthase GlgA [Holophagales bacterium]
MKVLHAAAELFPYVKVGGLADVMGALPQALSNEGVYVRLLLPAYPALMKVARIYGTHASYPDLMGGGSARLLLADVPGSVPIYLLDAPGYFNRDCGPYDEWGDNHRRFSALSWVTAQLALNGDAEGMRPDVVHLHDWQTALTPVFMSLSGSAHRPKTVLTIHNLAYQGVFPQYILDEIWLPHEAFHLNGAEYFGKINYLKAGLAYTDKITTVSPTYAREIQGKEGGYTLEGILQRRSKDLVGILNGVDELVWNPSKDPHLQTPFNIKNLKLNKGYNKKAFQREMGLNEDENAQLFGIVSRFDAIKGLDLVIPNIDYMVSLGAQLAVLGRGNYDMESAFSWAAGRHPGSVATFTGYDEGKAHRLMAASDVLLVPSRSEPCGLTQLYAMRYGALPVARKTGGLADTIVDVTSETLKDGTATGFLFFDPESWRLGEAITRAVSLYKNEPEIWEKIQTNAMAQHFTWTRSAKQYAKLYKSLLGQ